MAVNVSSAYLNALKEGLREPRAYIHNLNQDEIITDDNEIVSFKIYSQLQRENNIFGNTIAKYAEIEVKNIGNSQFNDWLDNSIVIYLGLSLNGTPEYVNQGRFRIYNIEYDRDKQTAKFEAFDRMVRFNRPYRNGDTIFPISLGDFFAEIVEAVGLEAGSTIFPNSTFEINEPNVSDDEFTYRNVLAWIAELAGGNAVIGRDGKVYIQSFGVSPVYDIDADEYFTLETQEKFGPIEKVRMIREFEDIVEFPAGEGISYDIVGNQLAYDQREAIIEDIYDFVEGLEYVPFTLKYRGTAHLDFCDLVEITNSEDEVIQSYIMNHILTFDGSMSEELNAVAYSPATEAIRSQGEIKNKATFTSARVDKVENQITLVASDLNDLSGNFSQLQLELEGITATVQATNDTIGTLQSQITQNADNVNIAFSQNTEIRQYYNYSPTELSIGRPNQQGVIKIGFPNNVPEIILSSGAETASIKSDQMTISNIIVGNTLDTGKHTVKTLEVGGIVYTVFLPQG
jgi:hypothetical protein